MEHCGAEQEHSEPPLFQQIQPTKSTTSTYTFTGETRFVAGTGEDGRPSKLVIMSVSDAVVTNHLSAITC